ncbi:MAG: hypothetical protein DWQ05_05275 [Calditrichaeota bacterium]|nr:MAG: hypothetical protein DWQ05_05275 [Calditrichota bacterium]
MKFQIVLLLMIFNLIQAQTKEQIKNSTDYYYGSGVSSNVREARDRALEELTEQIAVRVAKSFELKIQESSGNLDDNVKSILKTHSTATLKNVKTIKKPMADGRIEVFCYLSKKEVAKVFDERKRLISDFVQNAEKNERVGQCANSLKLYYFSMLLLNSLPEQNVVYNGMNFTTTIPERINSLISKIHFELVDDVKIAVKEREITVKITHAALPVALLDFTFWDGSNQVSVQGRDGFATFHLLGASSAFKNLKLNIKYAYYDARDEYNVIADLWNVVDKPVFDAVKTLKLTTKSERDVLVKPQKVQTQNWNLKLEYEGDIPLTEKVAQSVAEFLDVVTAGDKKQIRQKYKNDPFLNEKIQSYIAYNHPKVLSKTIQAKVCKTKSGYELRKIRMLHNYATINKQATEYLVLDFAENGELIDFNTSIAENLYNEFVKQSEFGRDWNQRHQIIKFIEKYRTAYLTRTIETVDLMFAEDALILIGRRIERKILPENTVQFHKFGNEPDYEYIRLTKEKYLSRQRTVFNSQKDIFLDFGSFDIVQKNNAKNVYGVEMRQSYASTTYSDEGYLFLLMDFSERDPMIYVRAWQPNEWSDSSLVRTANFRVYK